MKLKLLPIVIVCAAAFLAGCGKPADSTDGGTAGGASSEHAAEASAHEGWLTNFDEALAKAKAENKLVLADFTGSDWCPPCMALAKEIFATDEFKKYAADNLVLLELDFPRRKPQSGALKKANEALSEKFNIEGFPTVIVFNGEGKELKRDVGFGGESPAEYIAKLEALKKG
jgi:thiol:disulfide interchange protein